MIGLWYNKSNLLKGEWLNNVIVRIDTEYAQTGASVSGGICQTAEYIRRNGKPLGERKNKAEYNGDEKNQSFLWG